MMRAGVLLLLLTATSAHAESDALCFARARGLAENGDFTRSVEHWRHLCERHPDAALARVGLAQSLRRGEHFDQAARAIEEAQLLGEASAQLLWQEGLTRNLLGQPAAALRALDAIQPAPQQATYHHQRGLALQQLDRLEESCAAFARAGELDPELFAARYAHFLCLRELDAPSSAALLAQIETLRRAQPEWIRNDQLRLEAGPLSDLLWPDAYAGLQSKLGGPKLSIELQGVRNVPDGKGSLLELWIGDSVLRKVVDRPPLQVGLGGAQRIDVVRVVWPNGIAQNLFDVDLSTLDTSRLVIREQLFIKGSWGGIQAREPDQER